MVVDPHCRLQTAFLSLNPILAFYPPCGVLFSLWSCSCVLRFSHDHMMEPRSGRLSMLY